MGCRSTPESAVPPIAAGPRLAPPAFAEQNAVTTWLYPK